MFKAHKSLLIVLFIGLLAIGHVAIENGSKAQIERKTYSYNTYLQDNTLKAYHEPTSINIIDGRITAYNAVPEQTDSTPCISASGMNVCETNINVVANNCLPFGTLVSINNIIYSVEDRMNSRYDCKWFDILLDDVVEAKKFGKKDKAVIILND